MSYHGRKRLNKIFLSISSMFLKAKYEATEAFEQFKARLVFNKKGQHGDHYSANTAAEGRDVNIIDIGVASTFFFYYIRIILMITLETQKNLEEFALYLFRDANLQRGYA
jgi:hypothetical protein